MFLQGVSPAYRTILERVRSLISLSTDLRVFAHWYDICQTIGLCTSLLSLSLASRMIPERFRSLT